jgi:thymidylate kinase
MPQPAQSIEDLHQAEPSALGGGSESCSGPGLMLSRVFEALDRANIPYCVTHGYQSYPQRITSSDVDILISGEVPPNQVAILLYESGLGGAGGELVCHRGYYMVLAAKNADCSPCHLEFDLGVDYKLGDLQFYTGREVVQSRRRHNKFWVPAPALEFGCYLVRRIAKRQLDDDQGRRLTTLYEQDRIGSQQQIARFWGPRRSALIASAARSGNWDLVRGRLVPLGIEMRARVMLRRPWGVFAGWLRRVGRRIRLACRSEGGLAVVVLGPDGAGKSSVINAVAKDMIGAFPRARCYSFPPAVLARLRQRPEGPFTLPHELAPRSYMMSVVRAVCYWFVYYQLCYRSAVGLHLARSILVLHDRHLVDALVDPERYRYSGPMWLLRLIWWFVPKPDLVILLDAPPEVLQSRKQEVSFAESERQRNAYRSLVGSMANGHIIDAVRPLEEVVSAVNDLILHNLSARVACRLNIERNRSWRRRSARSVGGTRASRFPAGE